MKKKILIADDDRVLVELLSTRLRGKGFEVAVAFDAAQAFMGIMRVLPDAILLDIKMPGGSGLDLLKKLKASTKVGSVPVIVMSALGDPSLPTTVKGLGATEFLPKPVRVEQVYKTLCGVLEIPPV
jgi:DNA-binding response OmpR family regulator